MEGQDSKRENSLQIFLETQWGTTDQHLFADPRKMARSSEPCPGPLSAKAASFTSVTSRKSSNVGILPDAGSLSQRLCLIIKKKKKKAAHGIHRKLIASENSWRVSALSTGMENTIKIESAEKN